MKQVQLFITCLGEQFYTSTLQHMTGILEGLGVKPIFPQAQTCCGQPLFNNGFSKGARTVAIKWMNTFARNDAPIVCPSASCAGMVRHHYVELFPPGSPEYTLACELAPRVFEFTEYLVRELGVVDVGARFPHRVTYHPSCHHARELGLTDEAKMLIGAVRGLEVLPLPEEEACCGFGGAFSVTFPEVSRAMMDAKIRNIIASGAEAVVTCEPGCLMNVAGGLRAAGSSVRAMHIIDLLASQ
ncbi:MAG TPA: (Fe-S)-binding protein [Thermoleophilia bacterium]|nr:(Fe-S)-binding protein [Thermoleophilia bacterium]